MTKAGTYDVAGVVIAKNSRSIMINDGTGSAMVFLYANKVADERLATYSIGDYLEVKETLTDGTYQPNNGFYQFSTGATISKLTETAPSVPEAVELTTSVADGWKTVTKDSSAQKLYKWESVAGEVNGYATLNLSGSSIAIEPMYLDSAVFTIVSGKTYNIEAVFCGYNTKNSYAAVMVTKVSEVEGGDPAKPTAKTVSDFVDGNGVSEGTLYSVSGILEGKNDTDMFGNGYLSDPVSKKSMMIYGSTTTSSALSGTTFTNPKDAVTSLKDVHNGDLVTMTVVYGEDYYGKAIMGIITAHESTTTKYAVTVGTITNGTVVSDKETAAYGETVTLTITPSQGYILNELYVTTLYGVNVIKDGDSYTFLATSQNEVTANFVSDAAPTETTTYSFSEKASSWGNSYAEHYQKIGGVAFGFSSGNYSMYSGWSDKMAVLGKGAQDILITSPWNMSKVEVTGTTWNKDKVSLALSYYTDEGFITDDGTGASFVDDTELKSESVDISTSASFSTKQVKVSLTGDGARVGIESIIITF